MSNKVEKKTPVVLVILDGWGYRPDLASNAIANAKTPMMDRLWSERPHSLINASGFQVGLPDGQMGNSEVGHVNIGAGRVVYQELTKVTKSILDGDFKTNPVLTGAIDKATQADKAVHIMGLLSPGGVHSHEDHIYAAIELASARGAKEIYLHAFLDGRDTPPRSAMKSLEHFQKLFDRLGTGRIASIIGRYFAMDRDNNWDRVQQAYDLLTLGKADYCYDNAMTALQGAYDLDKNDEFVPPTEIKTSSQSSATINDGDAVLFMNFRADRAREITRCFMDGFTSFSRDKAPKLADFVMLTQYATDIKASCAYEPEDLNNTLGDWLAQHHKTQLRISETEKYAHVTFFFNGGQEAVFEGEDRILVNSPKVATYDLQPEMSSRELTDKLVEAIKSGKYDMVICNYPNGDMVGHTGVYEAAVSACEAVDKCIAQVVEAVESVNGHLLITADHGNAEMMADPATGQAHTAHTNLPVPLIYVGSRDVDMVEGGQLSDLAPTLLTLADMPQPKEMTGHSLLKERS